MVTSGQECAFQPFLRIGARETVCDDGIPISRGRRRGSRLVATGILRPCPKLVEGRLFRPFEGQPGRCGSSTPGNHFQGRAPVEPVGRSAVKRHRWKRDRSGSGEEGRSRPGAAALGSS